MHRAHGSGESDDQIITKAHAIYKSEEKKGKIIHSRVLVESCEGSTKMGKEI